MLTPCSDSSIVPGIRSVADAIAERRRERERLLGLARSYVDRLGERIDIEAAVIVGSVARGDFNVWSDVDVLIVAEGLPARAPDRAATLLADAPPGVQPIGWSRAELIAAWEKGNPLAREAATGGVVVVGGELVKRLTSLPT